ncbi:MAG: hypothetical protein ACLRVU_01415 [Beduini sp.]|uniref:hypothetical protein n=1 Tax=Beduini sp. TaxID=1922300 RepID=UPI00399F5DF5
MKKLLICLLCLGLWTGCSPKKDTPTTAAQTYLKEAKEKVNEASQEVLDQFTGTSGFTIPNDLIKKLSDFSFTITNEKITDTTATVDVTFTAYDFGKAFKATFPSAFAYSLNESLSGTDQETISQEVQKMFIDGFNTAEKDFTTTLTLSLHQDESEKWVVDDNQDLQNIISGNLVNTVKELNDSFNPQ